MPKVLTSLPKRPRHLHNGATIHSKDDSRYCRSLLGDQTVAVIAGGFARVYFLLPATSLWVEDIELAVCCRAAGIETIVREGGLPAIDANEYQRAHWIAQLYSQLGFARTLALLRGRDG